METITSILVAALATTLVQSRVLAQASVDEKAVTRTIHVSASNADDANSGADDKPLKTIRKAISLAGDKPTRILVHPGTYREYITLGRGDATLIVEATDPGKAIISGADAVTDWKDEGGGLFSLAWKNRWGVNGEFHFPGDRTVLNRRREMVFIDDVRLAQRCNEDKLGSAVATASLKPGEFTVNEDEQKIYLKPPAGVTLGKTSRIEVSARGYSRKPLVYVADRSNLVLRGLRIIRSANYIGSNSALTCRSDLAGRDSSKWPGNILIDRCAFDQNNGTGLALCTVRNVSVVNCSMSENGNRGGGGHCVRDLLVADTQFNDNGWRFGPWLVGHDMAGFKLFDGADSDRWFVARSSGVRFLRCTFRGNRCHNLWQDFGPTGSVVESCLFEDSPHTAVFQEVTPGGLRMKDCVIRRCGQGGDAAVLVVASPDVTLSGCTIYDCGSEKIKYCTLVSMIGDKRTVSPKMENAVRRLRIENCMLQANCANSYLFRCGSWNGADVPRKDFAETAQLDGNTYFCADRPLEGMGEYKMGKNSFFRNTFYSGNDKWKNDYPDMTLEQWQKLAANPAGPQDAHSKWLEVPRRELDAKSAAAR